MTHHGNEDEHETGPGVDPGTAGGPPTQTGETATGAGDVEGAREQLQEEAANPAAGGTLPG